MKTRDGVDIKVRDKVWSVFGISDIVTVSKIIDDQHIEGFSSRSGSQLTNISLDEIYHIHPDTDIPATADPRTAYMALQNLVVIDRLSDLIRDLDKQRIEYASNIERLKIVLEENKRIAIESSKTEAHT